MNQGISIHLDPQLLNIAHPTWDTFLVLFFIIAVVLYSFFANRERLAVVLLSVYSSIAIINATPIIQGYLAGLPGNSATYYRLVLFIGAFLVLFVLFTFNMSLHSDIGQSWLHAILLSFLQVGLLISTILAYIPSDIFSTQFARSFFTDDTPRSFWMIAPIFVMLFMHKKSSAGQQ